MKARTGKIVVFGSIVHDLISYTNCFPRPGESVRGLTFKQGAGGKGANQAVAAALIGGDVSLIGRVGEDIFADYNLAAYVKANVNHHAVKRCSSNSTGTATITVNQEGENSIVVTLGANSAMTPEVAEENEDLISSATILLCQAEIPQESNRRAFEIARKHGVKTFFNPAPGDPSLDKSLLQLVDIICTNENEAEFMCGVKADNIAGAKIAVQEMLRMGPKVAIVTLGSLGCIIGESSHDGITVNHVPVERVNAVDTTGAGDCFCGSLAVLLLADEIRMENAVEKAAGIATLSVQRRGTQTSYHTREEIVRMGKGHLVEGI